MEIKQEDFDKLNQLDRIEYRQKFLIMESESITSNIILIYPFLIFVISSLCYLQEDFTSAFIFILMGCLLFVVIVFYTINLIYNQKNLIKKINEKYFGIELKKKK